MPSKRESQARELAASGYVHDRLRALAYKSVPVDVVEALTQDRYRWVAERAWSHPKLPTSKLRSGVRTAKRHLDSGDFESPVVNGVLRNPNLTAEMLTALEAHPWALTHANFPADRAILIASDRSKATVARRKTLAKCSGLDIEVQRMLARDPVAGVRAALALNRTIHAETALILVDDSSIVVLRNILGNEAVEPHRQSIVDRLAANNRGMETSMAVAHNTENPEHLASLVENQHWWIAARALRNEHVTPEVLEQACYHESRYVRDAAVQNPKTPEEAAVVAALMSGTGPSF